MSNPFNSDGDRSADAGNGSNPAPEDSSAPGNYSTPSDSGLPSYGSQPQASAYSGASYGGAMSDPAQSAGKKSTMALVTLIFGVLSLLTMIFGVGILLGFITVILAIIAFIRNRSKAAKDRRTWMTVTGLVLAAVAVVGGLYIIGSFVAVFSDCVTLDDQDAINQCVEDKLQVQ
ncbi:hypothetical protein [Corynebacterium flavescens]|uniref:hypothetical protein n=1 Tax=Corynebacterium flavescens TaxID=28028 RepID=UPI000EC52FAD|nr:hypothetical protein [Corynebacterium flavescens]